MPKNDLVTSQEFKKHCQSNGHDFGILNKKLEKLEPLAELAELIGPLKAIVKVQEFQTAISKKIAKWIGVAALVVGIIAGILASLKYIFDIWKR
jgi:hypothetical protein